MRFFSEFKVAWLWNNTVRMRASWIAGWVAVAMLAQAQPEVSFEVASIHAGDSQPQVAGLRFLPSGEMVARNFPLELLIQEVFGVSEFQVIGLERWTTGWATTRLNIQAKAQPKASGAASEDELKSMARALLAERFELRFHREKREASVYALVAAKNGIKLQVSEDNGRQRGVGGINSSIPMGRLFGSNVTMAHFVQILSEQQLERPVVDRTGFEEPFDFQLEYAPIERPDSRSPSIFVALQEQLGLKLEPAQAQVEVLVIDHIARPSEN